MSNRHRRLLDAIRSKPPPANVKWDELVAALKSIGFRVLNRSGSRRQFYHPGCGRAISCHQPHPSPDVDKGCLADIGQFLNDNGL